MYELADYQVHTRYSGRAEDRMTPEAIVAHAGEIGLREVGFTDHIYAYTTLDDLRQLEAGVRAVHHPTVKARFGIEAEMADAQHTTVPDGWRDRFDYVLLALDHAKACDYDVPPRDRPAAWIDHYQQGYHLAGEGEADVLAHPFSGCPEALDLISDSQLLGMLGDLHRGNVAIEINGRRINTYTNRDAFERLYRMAKEVGLKFSLGSDAHDWAELMTIFEVKPWLDRLELGQADLWRPTPACKALEGQHAR